MHTVAPDKPLFVTQSGTTVYNLINGEIILDVAAKNQWLYDTYTYLSTFPDLFGVLYYNRWADEEGCQWAYYYKYGSRDDGYQYEGYRQAIANPSYQYMPPQELMQQFP